MAPRRWFVRVAVAALAALLSGCFDEAPDTSNVVFLDGYTSAIYQAFAKSKLDAASIDSSVFYAGSASLRYTVPSPGEPGAGEFNFSGGAFTSDRPLDLSKFTALTFWAKASRNVTLDSAGFGNDNTGTSKYQTEVKGLAVLTDWSQYVIPIPAPQKMAAERGLFWLAAGAKGTPPTGYRMWFDEIKYENLPTAGWNPRPTLTKLKKGLAVGETVQIAGTAVDYSVNGRDLRVQVFPATFDYTSSNPAAATVSSAGLVTAAANGTAVITATLNGVAAPQTVTVIIPPPVLKQMDLPLTFDADDVAYGFVGFAGAEDSTIVDDPTGGTNQVARVNRSATADTFAGTSLTTPDNKPGPGFATKVPFTATATKMTVRVYSPDAGVKVRLKVEDHGSSATSVETDATTTQANAWETLTFDFANQAAGTAALNPTKTYDKATIFFNFGKRGADAGAKTYYFDDVAFAGGATTKTQMDLPVTFDAPNVDYGLLGFEGAEDSSIVADPAGGSNNVARVIKSATAQTFAGTTLTKDGALGFATKIPFTASATRMTVRVYSPDAGIKVRLKVEDHTNAGISVETEATTTKVNTWETLTFDFASQASGTAALDLAKSYDKATLFFNFGVSGQTAGAKTYHFDDVAFGGGSATALAAGPPAPTLAPADVISLYSDSYASVPVDTFGTDWSNNGAGANLTEVTLGGNNVKRYAALLYAGIEFIGMPAGTREIDATAMTHFHLDVWTADATVFRVKLVDFGNDRAFAGGDDTEHELTFNAASTPRLETGQWVGLDLPLASFTGLASRAHLAQLVISASTSTVYIDNVYFHR